MKVDVLVFRRDFFDADLLYPRIGEHPSRIAYTEADLSEPGAAPPVDLDGPLMPRFAERSAG